MSEDSMKEVVEKTLNALFNLEDIRQVWRETTPIYKLSNSQKESVRKLLLETRDLINFVLERLK